MLQSSTRSRGLYMDRIDYIDYSRVLAPNTSIHPNFQVREFGDERQMPVIGAAFVPIQSRSSLTFLSSRQSSLVPESLGVQSWTLSVVHQDPVATRH